METPGGVQPLLLSSPYQYLDWFIAFTAELGLGIIVIIAILVFPSVLTRGVFYLTHYSLLIPFLCHCVCVCVSGH